jgi:16S rRNA processing protein RimM
MTSDKCMVVVGRIAGMYGVRGWVKVFSHTDPRENILQYKPWYLYRDGQWQEVELAEGRRQGKGVVAHIASCDDREQARQLVNTDIAIRRDQLPEVGADEFYWTDLIGLQVKNQNDLVLGKVDHLMETGANDVLVVRNDREYLIPFVLDDVIIDIDLEKGVIRVDWDPDY